MLSLYGSFICSYVYTAHVLGKRESVFLNSGMFSINNAFLTVNLTIERVEISTF